MAKLSKYSAKKADDKGFIAYTDEEHAVWHDLITKQVAATQNYACPEFIAGLSKLNLPADHIPQCSEVSRVLMETTGWRVAPVAALIDFATFFGMLSQKIFPAASFIRRRDELEYLQEPDIFHEIFGHTPLLTDTRFAAFTHSIGNIGAQISADYYVWLARLYWMTVEFGLIQSSAGLRVYGAGLASSISEIRYSLESKLPDRRPMDVLTALRTPYRIDIHQPIYYVINDFDELFDMSKLNIVELIDEARMLGMLEPAYSMNNKNHSEEHAA